MKKTWMIILALTMLLMVFTVACGEAGPAASDAQDSRQLEIDEDNGDVEAARTSDSSGEINFDEAILVDLLALSGSDDASFRGTARDTSGWASAGNN